MQNNFVSYFSGLFDHPQVWLRSTLAETVASRPSSREAKRSPNNPPHLQKKVKGCSGFANRSRRRIFASQKFVLENPPADKAD